jgi:hypothetical protein
MNWKQYKSFNQLFTDGETPADLLKCSLAQRANDMGYIVENKKVIIKTDLFDDFYSKQIADKYNTYKSLLEKYNLLETTFKESDLEALIKIETDKEQILDNNKSIKEISTLYFNDAKYIKTPKLIYNAVLKVLGKSELPIDEHDQQYLWVLHCKNKIPKAIILCENDNLLRKERLNDIELWHAGGRNTAKLKFIAETTIPLYYLCDWDNRGIEIYQDIKKNIFPNIELLVPQEPIKFLDIKSEWKTQIDYFLFSDEAKSLLQKIVPEKWIEEESINHKLLKRK